MLFRSGSGTKYFPYSSGYLSFNEIEQFHFVPTQQGATANLTGNVSVSNSNANVTGSSTTFLTNYVPGDYIGVDGANRQITFVGNNTFLQVESAFPATNTNSTHKKVFPVGSPIPFRNRNARTIIAHRTTSNDSAPLASPHDSNPAYDQRTHDADSAKDKFKPPFGLVNIPYVKKLIQGEVPIKEVNEQIRAYHGLPPVTDRKKSNDNDAVLYYVLREPSGFFHPNSRKMARYELERNFPGLPKSRMDKSKLREYEIGRAHV